MPARAKGGRESEMEGRRKKEGIAAAHWFAGTGMAEMEDGCAQSLRRTCLEVKSGDQRQTKNTQVLAVLCTEISSSRGKCFLDLLTKQEHTSTYLVSSILADR